MLEETVARDCIGRGAPRGEYTGAGLPRRGLCSHLMFIQLSQLTRCPLYVSPFLSSTSCVQRGARVSGRAHARTREASGAPSDARRPCEAATAAASRPNFSAAGSFTGALETNKTFDPRKAKSFNNCNRVCALITT